MRKRAILGALAAIPFAAFAAAGQAAEVMGTIVSNDPTGRTVVVRTADGQTLSIRTDEATRIEQGDALVETTTLMRGVPVQIVTTDVVTGETSVAPLATRILVVPSKPSVMEDDDDTDVDIDTDDEDVDIDTDDENDD
jgi:hypothetical protein